MKKRKQIKSHPGPILHQVSREIHPVPRKEANKTLLIALISMAAITVLVLLLFFASQFVGKAIQYGSPSGSENEGGIFVVGGEESVHQPFVVPIKAHLASPAVGVSFTLQYNPEKLTADCSNIFAAMDSHFVMNGHNLSVVKKVECGNGNIHFEYVGLCDESCSNALQGEITIAEITFLASEAGNYPLVFSEFNVIHLNDVAEDLIGDGVGATLTIVAPVLQVQQQSRGGYRCISDWNCAAAWSICNATLQQSRVCYDQKNCNPKQPTKSEVRSCESCPESWVCTEWGVCHNNVRTRECLDENKCGTIIRKPLLQQSCTELLSPQSQTTGQQEPLTPPPQREQPTPIAEKAHWKIFWKQSKALIGGAGLGMILIIMLIALLVHRRHPKVGYNLNELQKWVQQEKKMGTSAEDIKKILAQNTGWKEKEIEEVFTELKELEIQQK